MNYLDTGDTIRWTLSEPVPWQATGIAWTVARGWCTWRDDPDNAARVERGELPITLLRPVDETSIPEWARDELKRLRPELV